MEKTLHQETEENLVESDAYPLYVYAIRSPTTKDTYLRRLRIFFNYIHLMSINDLMKVHCNHFADKANADPKWAFIKIIEFLQFQKERVENKKWYYYMAKDQLVYISVYRKCIDELELVKKECWNKIMNANAKNSIKIQSLGEIHSVTQTIALLLRDFICNKFVRIL